MRFRFSLWLIRVIGVIVPRRLRADWRQEWEAELRYRELLLADWDNLNWKTFYSNVEALPIDAKSTFIRAVLNARAYSNRRRNAIRSVTLLSSISELLDGIKEGRITMYEQLNALSR